MKTYRCDDWSHLSGAKVEIHRRGRLVRAGTVDVVMADNSLLWLAGDHNGPRKLFESAEEYEVWADANDLPDEHDSAVLGQQPPTGQIAGGDNNS